MASPSELSLDCKPDTLLKSFGDKTHDEKTQKLEEILSHLQEERLKIDAFKRELPLCMQLLSNAVETSKQQLQTCKENDHQEKTPVLEEFIPINKHLNSEEKQEKIEYSSEKANWMTTAQLWCQTSANTIAGSNNIQQSNVKTSIIPTPNKNTSFGFDLISPKINLETKQIIGGAFLPFSKDGNGREVTDLALIGSNETGDDDDDNHRKGFECRDSNNGSGVINEHIKAQVGAIDTHNLINCGNSNQNHRKARRCWSPDLHRRFLNALEMLGGSQAATPKQIRELMKVDGLTNDEVKSHLQKYRLHTRRPTCPNPQGGGTPQPQQQPQLVVLGGIWVPPPEYTSAHNGAPTITTLYSAAHQVSHAPSHYCATHVASHQDHLFYAHTNNNSGNPPLIHNHRGQLLHVYNSPVQTRSSAESDGRGNGDDRSESIEDGKSESISWKEGENGRENGVERKGLVALREGEETNESEVTLKVGVTTKG